MNQPTHSRQPSAPRSGRLIVYILAALALVALPIDLLYEQDAHFQFEKWFGFWAFFGLLASALLVLVARALRPLVLRDEDYYER